MANTDNPHGLRAVKNLHGGPIPCRRYTAATTTAIFQGDVVVLRTAGKVATLLTTNAAQVGTLGVAANYTATSGYVWVYDDPYTIFEIQSDGTTDPGATTALAHLGANASVVLTAGTAATKMSNHELDYSSLASTTTLPLRVVGFDSDVRNDTTLAHARYLVMLNKPFMGTKGIAVGL